MKPFTEKPIKNLQEFVYRKLSRSSSLEEAKEEYEGLLLIRNKSLGPNQHLCNLCRGFGKSQQNHIRDYKATSFSICHGCNGTGLVDDAHYKILLQIHNMGVKNRSNTHKEKREKIYNILRKLTSKERGFLRENLDLFRP